MQYRISVDLAPLQASIDKAGAELLGAVNIAVRMTAAELAQQWQEATYRLAPAFVRQAAVDSIKVSDDGPFSSTVSSDSQDVRYIEEGTPARDLKLMLQTSNRVKVSAKGRKFLTIPMRHGTTGNALAPQMPPKVYAQAKQLDPSAVTGRLLRPGYQGGVVPRLTYQWGGRLPAGLVPKLKPSHKVDPLAGMVRMSTGPRSSAYLTFRILHEDAPAGSWTIPARPGMFVLRDLAAQGQKTLADRIGDILKAVGT